MLENLKSKVIPVLQTIKDLLLLIVFPILTIGAYIYYLSRKNKTLEDELEITKSSKELAGKLAEKEEAKHDADRIEQEYRDTVNDYYGKYGKLQADTDAKPESDHSGGSEGRQD